MPRQVALLRAINVGGRTVRMAELRTRFEELGFANVETFIASGNVIFDSRVTNSQRLEQQIARHLKDAFGYEITAFVRTIAEMESIVAYRPFPAADLRADGVSLYVMFLPDPLGRTRRRDVQALATPQDALHVRGREIYWLARNKLTGTLVDGAALAKAIGMPTSMRNMSTVRKIAERYGRGPSAVRATGRR
jgi:uncharacterized protein (DUF1697 family)